MGMGAGDLRRLIHASRVHTILHNSDLTSSASLEVICRVQPQGWQSCYKSFLVIVCTSTFHGTVSAPRNIPVCRPVRQFVRPSRLPRARHPYRHEDADTSLLFPTDIRSPSTEPPLHALIFVKAGRHISFWCFSKGIFA